MLVLSRQREETIMIGDDIEITVVDIRGDKVRLGISAPRQVQVHRKEVYETITVENAGATQVRVDDLTEADRQLRRLCTASKRRGHQGPHATCIQTGDGITDTPRGHLGCRHDPRPDLKGTTPVVDSRSGRPA